MTTLLKKLRSSVRQFGILLVLAIMMIVFSIGSDVFLTYNNFISIFQQASIKGVLAVGMTLIIILGGIDLSVGSILGLSSIIAATIMTEFSGPAFIWVGFAAALLVGVGCGLLNGILIAFCDLQPFLVTMGTLSLFRGIDYIFSGAIPVRGLPQEFTGFFSSLNDTFPVPVIILLGIALIFYLVIKFTKYGRYIFAIGGNAEATYLSGIDVRKVKVLTYVLCAITGVIAGFIYMGRLAAADPNMGNGYELDAIAAAAIGGASMSGGKGGIVGSLLGALMLAMLANGLTLLNIQSFYQTAATGLIIIIAVLIDRYTNK